MSGVLIRKERMQRPGDRQMCREDAMGWRRLGLGGESTEEDAEDRQRSSEVGFLVAQR